MSSDDRADRDGKEAAAAGGSAGEPADAGAEAGDSAAESLTPEELSWRDFVAIAVALTQTVLLPFLLVALFLLLFYVASVYLL